VKLNGAPFFLYLLFEHKSYLDRMVAFQILKYMVRIWELFLEQNKNASKLPGIFPMLIYHGKTGWNVDKRFSSLLNIPKGLSEHLSLYIPDYEYQLYDLSHTPDEDIKGDVEVRILFLTLKYVFQEGLSERLVGIFRLFADIVNKKKSTEYLEVLLRYLSRGVESLSFKQLQESLERSNIDGGDIMPTIAQELMNKGRIEGIDIGKRQGKIEGIDIGKKQGKIEMALALLKIGVPIEKIVANILQPRKDFGDLEEMAESIKEKGILEPVLIRQKNGNFEIVAGERRFRAAKLAGHTEIPCIEHDIADNEALELSIIENIQRKDLNIYEQAFSLKSLADIYGYTHQDIAQKIGKSRVTVTELLRITDLPEEILEKCQTLNIHSKTFLLELAKLEDMVQMEEMLDEYSEKPFSREKIKEKRKENPQDGVEKSIKTFRFNVVSDDKAIKIKFDIKSRENDKEKIISILEKLISDIKEDRIKELSFRADDDVKSSDEDISPEEE